MTLRQFTVFAGVLAIFAAAPAFAQENAAPATGEQAHAGAPKGKFGDTDNDGFISKDEFLAKQAERFGEMDKDGDGKLGEGELKAYYAKMNAMRGNFAKRKAQEATPAPVAE